MTWAVGIGVPMTWPLVLGERVDLRSAVVEVDRSRVAAGGDAIGDAAVDVRRVFRVAGADAILAVGLEVIDDAEARAVGRSLGYAVLRLILGVVVVVAEAEVEAEVVAEIPLVVHEGRLRLDVAGLRELRE